MARRGPASIELVLPADAPAAAGLTIRAAPSVSSLQVSVDGSPAVAVPRAGRANAWVVTPPSGSAPTSMEVRYLVDGAIVRSPGAVPGRALALLTPLSAAAAGDLPVTVAVAGAEVLEVYCPAGTTPATLQCGQLDGDRWLASLPAGPPLVVAQLDLPPLA